MNPVGQNAWVLASRIAPQLGGVLLLVLGARFLDPATLGSFVLIFAWTELLRRLVRAGWREAVVMDAAGEATPAVTTLACAAAVAALALVALSALALRHAALDPAYVHCLLLLGASLLPVAPSVIWEGLLLRTRRTDLEAATVIAAEAAHLALAALLLAAGLGIAGLALARLVRALVAFAGLGWATGWPLRPLHRLAPRRGGAAGLHARHPRLADQLRHHLRRRPRHRRLARPGERRLLPRRLAHRRRRRRRAERDRPRPRLVLAPRAPTRRHPRRPRRAASTASSAAPSSSPPRSTSASRWSPPPSSRC